jgi:hypothetical protein
VGRNSQRKNRNRRWAHGALAGRTLALALDVYNHITQLKSDVSVGLTGFIASNCAFNGDDRNAR